MLSETTRRLYQRTPYPSQVSSRHCSELQCERPDSLSTCLTERRSRLRLSLATSAGILHKLQRGLLTKELQPSICRLQYQYRADGAGFDWLLASRRHPVVPHVSSRPCTEQRCKRADPLPSCVRGWRRCLCRTIPTASNNVLCRLHSHLCGHKQGHGVWQLSIGHR